MRQFLPRKLDRARANTVNLCAMGTKRKNSFGKNTIYCEYRVYFPSGNCFCLFYFFSFVFFSRRRRHTRRHHQRMLWNWKNVAQIWKYLNKNLWFRSIRLHCLPLLGALSKLLFRTINAKTRMANARSELACSHVIALGLLAIRTFIWALHAAAILASWLSARRCFVFGLALIISILFLV